MRDVVSETNAIGTIIGGPDYLEFPQSCGKPHPIVSLKFVDPDTLDLCEKKGEICIQSVTNMKKYWNLEQETKEILLPGGWIRSGDLAEEREDGFIFIIDRIKDIVIRGGENISTFEVDEEVYKFGKDVFVEVCTFGLPDDRLGEILACTIVPKDGSKFQVKELDTYLRSKLAPFKVPAKYFVRQTPLPRGPTGKLLKRKVKEEYLNIQAVSVV